MYEQRIGPANQAGPDRQDLVQRLGAGMTIADKPRYMVPDGLFALGQMTGAGERVTSRYGMRMHPVLGVQKMHTGVDYGVPMNTQLTAPFAGTVSSAQMGGAAGKKIVMDVDGGGQVSFSHLNNYASRPGDKKSLYQPVGWSGNTGRSTGPHLHLEMKNATGQRINPADTASWTHQMRQQAAQAGFGSQWQASGQPAAPGKSQDRSAPKATKAPPLAPFPLAPRAKTQTATTRQGTGRNNAMGLNLASALGRIQQPGTMMSPLDPRR